MDRYSIPCHKLYTKGTVCCWMNKKKLFFEEAGKEDEKEEKLINQIKRNVIEQK